MYAKRKWYAKATCCLYTLLLMGDNTKLYLVCILARHSISRLVTTLLEIFMNEQTLKIY